MKEEQEESSDRVREASAKMPRPATSLAHTHTYMTVERVKSVAVDEIQGQSKSDVELQQQWGGKQQARIRKRKKLFILTALTVG